MVLGVKRVRGTLCSLEDVVSGAEKVRLVAVVPYSTLPWVFSSVVQEMILLLAETLAASIFWAGQAEARVR